MKKDTYYIYIWTVDAEGRQVNIGMTETTDAAKACGMRMDAIKAGFRINIIMNGKLLNAWDAR